MFRSFHCLILAGAILACSPSFAQEVTYHQDVAPLLTKYCVGCHNATDAEAGLAMHSFENLRKGSEEGLVLDWDEPIQSILWKRITGELEPIMPPEGEPVPSKAEVEVLRRWFETGMDLGEAPKSSMPEFPELKAAPARSHAVGAACAVGSGVAIGSLGRVVLQDATGKERWVATDLVGKVNSLRTSEDRTKLVVGGGLTGHSGEALLLDANSGQVVGEFRGHADAIYCAALSPSGKLLATGSYDKEVWLWDVASGRLVRKLTGHNGAIYDLDFDPTGEVLASASADQTVKLWRVATGDRLDTLGQPEGEVLCVRFSSDGKHVIAAGADRQIRQWEVVSRTEPSISPLLVSRYAHESSVERLELVDDFVISASADKTAKLWTQLSLEPRGTLAELSETPVAICVAPKQANLVTIWDLRGNRTRILAEQIRRLAKRGHMVTRQERKPASLASKLPRGPTRELMTLEEREPNSDLQDAIPVELPAQITGSITASAEDGIDVDLYRFQAAAGSRWIFEVTTAKDSRLDSLIDVLDDTGEPVLRTRLQAVRESYFTFRGKDSDTSDDFRLHRWEDMELDEYLYAGGEVSRLWLYPRGPDSGFKVYPGFGKRQTFFGTTAISHALGDVAYVVRELAADEEALPNGLPVFPLYYENDDDGLRRTGRSSRLDFVAPNDGVFYLRVRDARGFSGEDFGYQLSMRPPQPDFQLSVGGTTHKLPQGSGREWSVTATRMDGMDGPIEVSIEGLPEGFQATNPLIIEAGQAKAFGAIYATSEVELGKVQLALTSKCQLGGQEILRPLKEKLQLEVVETQNEVHIELVSVGAGQEPITELQIRPGETISAKVVLQRNGEKARVSFGKDDSGRNLPHGAYVDNIGLNGLLIPEQYSEREFFITAAPKLQPGRRQFHLRAETKGKPTSRPIWLNVLPAEQSSLGRK